MYGEKLSFLREIKDAYREHLNAAGGTHEFMGVLNRIEAKILEEIRLFEEQPKNIFKMDSNVTFNSGTVSSLNINFSDNTSEVKHDDVPVPDVVDSEGEEKPESITKTEEDGHEDHEDKGQPQDVVEPEAEPVVSGEPKGGVTPESDEPVVSEEQPMVDMENPEETGLPDTEVSSDKPRGRGRPRSE